MPHGPRLSNAEEVLGEEEEEEEAQEQMIILRQDLRGTRAEAELLRQQLLSARKELAGCQRERVFEAGEANRRECDLRAELARVRAGLEQSEAGASAAECELARVRRELAERERDRRLREREADETKSEHAKQLDALQSELSGARAAIQQRAAEQESRELALADKIRQLSDLLESRSSEVEAITRELQSVKADRDESETRRKSIAEQAAELRQSLLEAERSGAGQAEECLRLAERCRELAGQAAEAERQAQGERQSLEAERRAHAADQTRAEVAELAAAELDARLRTVGAERADAETRLAELEERLREERQGARCYREQFERLESEASGQRTCLEAEARSREKQLRRLEAKQAEAEAALSRLQSEAEGQGERLQELDKSFKAFIRQVQSACDKHLEPSQRTGSALRAPKVVLDQLAKLLKSQRDRQQDIEQELSSLKSEAGKHGATVKQLREAAWAKDKSLQASKEGEAAAQAEAKRLREKLAEVERRQASVRGLYTDAKRQLETEREQRQALQQDLDRIIRLRRSEESDRLAFLKALYIQLGGQLDETSKRLTAAQVQQWLTESVSGLLKEAQGWRGLLADSRQELSRRDVALGEADAAITEEKARWAAAAEELRRQKRELAQHYEELLKTEKQRSAEAAANAAASAYSPNADESQPIPSSNSAAELLTALALIASALVPLARRWRHLQRQKRCLLALVAASETRAVKMRMLADTLEGGGGNVGGCGGGVARRRLRAAVFAVMGARRLRRLGTAAASKNGIFRVSATLWLGADSSSSSGVNGNDVNAINERLTSWLGSSSLASAARAAHAEIERKRRHQLDLRVAAKQAATHLLDDLDAMFPPSLLPPEDDAMASSSGLWRYGGGAAANSGVTERLHRGVLSLCRRLSAAEAARDAAVAEAAVTAAEAERLRRESAPLDEHRALGAELAAAREREVKQGRQLAALAARVQALAGEDAERDRTLAEALAAVRDSRGRLEATGGRERALAERLATLETTLAGAEVRLAETARDSEAVAAYATSVGRLAERLLAEGVAEATGMGGVGDGGPQAASELLQSRQLLPPPSAGGGGVLARWQQAIGALCGLLAGAERRAADAQESLLAHRKMLVQLRRSVASATQPPVAVAIGTGGGRRQKRRI